MDQKQEKSTEKSRRRESRAGETEIERGKTERKDEERHIEERGTRRKERIEGEGRRGPPLAGLSGAVRMMNGRPARAVRALMGATELYITLLSVCERLLKVLKSPGSDTGPLPATKLPPPQKTATNDSVSPSLGNDNGRTATQVRTCVEVGGGLVRRGDDTQMDCLFSEE